MKFIKISLDEAVVLVEGGKQVFVWLAETNKNHAMLGVAISIHIMAQETKVWVQSRGLVPCQDDFWKVVQ